MPCYSLDPIDLTAGGRPAKRPRELSSDLEDPNKRVRLAADLDGGLLLGGPSYINHFLHSSAGPSALFEPSPSGSPTVEEDSMAMDVDSDQDMSEGEAVDHTNQSTIFNRFEPSDVSTLTDELVYQLVKSPLIRTIPLPTEDPADFWYGFNVRHHPPLMAAPATSVRADARYPTDSRTPPPPPSPPVRLSDLDFGNFE